MTQDRDREAMLVAWHDSKRLGYTHRDFDEFKKGWQVARDHYAPKLTEKEAVEMIAIFACVQCNFEWLDESEDERVAWRKEGLIFMEALKAVGMRFKEEA